jgi:hypothetical protein
VEPSCSHHGGWKGEEGSKGVGDSGAFGRTSRPPTSPQLLKFPPPANSLLGKSPSLGQSVWLWVHRWLNPLMRSDPSCSPHLPKSPAMTLLPWGPGALGDIPDANHDKSADSLEPWMGSVTQHGQGLFVSPQAPILRPHPIWRGTKHGRVQSGGDPRVVSPEGRMDAWVVQAMFAAVSCMAVCNACVSARVTQQGDTRDRLSLARLCSLWPWRQQSPGGGSHQDPGAGASSRQLSTCD